EMAERVDLDLVLVAPNAKPPVARIMDYGKYKYEQQKKREKHVKNNVSLTLKKYVFLQQLKNTTLTLKQIKRRSSYLKVIKLKLQFVSEAVQLHTKTSEEMYLLNLLKR